jgi:hypothetical protein
MKMRSKPSQHLFSIIDLAKWAPKAFSEVQGKQHLRRPAT